MLDAKIAVMKKLKILIFEYITGGGLNKSDLPESLAKEGLIMLQALVDGLAGMKTVELSVMLDFRLQGKLSFSTGNITIIGPEQACHPTFLLLMQTCDAVWPIAPESDGILQALCLEVERSGKLLLTSSAKAVAIAGDKWLTFQYLKRNFIATVQTQKLNDFVFTAGEWIVKPIDGVGCTDSFVIRGQQDFDETITLLEISQYIVQPHILGEKTSLSCLFKQGRGWLLCANKQHFELINKQYQLTEITVNFTSDTEKYLALVSKIAKAMPDLWGYVGIDLIEKADEILVLEINPRLTTSYAGIYSALGMNCARAIVALLTGDSQLQAMHNRAINIKISRQESDAS